MYVWCRAIKSSWPFRNNGIIADSRQLLPLTLDRKFVLSNCNFLKWFVALFGVHQYNSKNYLASYVPKFVSRFAIILADCVLY